MIDLHDLIFGVIAGAIGAIVAIIIIKYKEIK